MGLKFAPLGWIYHDSWNWKQSKTLISYDQNGNQIPIDASKECHHRGHVHLFLPTVPFSEQGSSLAYWGQQTYKFNVVDEWGPNSDDPSQGMSVKLVGKPIWYVYVEEYWRRFYAQPWDVVDEECTLPLNQEMTYTKWNLEEYFHSLISNATVTEESTHASATLDLHHSYEMTSGIHVKAYPTVIEIDGRNPDGTKDISGWNQLSGLSRILGLNDYAILRRRQKARALYIAQDGISSMFSEWCSNHGRTVQNATDQDIIDFIYDSSLARQFDSFHDANFSPSDGYIDMATIMSDYMSLRHISAKEGSIVSENDTIIVPDDRTTGHVGIRFDASKQCHSLGPFMEGGEFHFFNTVVNRTLPCEYWLDDEMRTRQLYVKQPWASMGISEDDTNGGQTWTFSGDSAKFVWVQDMFSDATELLGDEYATDTMASLTGYNGTHRLSRIVIHTNGHYYFKGMNAKRIKDDRSITVDLQNPISDNSKRLHDRYNAGTHSNTGRKDPNAPKEVEYTETGWTVKPDTTPSPTPSSFPHVEWEMDGWTGWYAKDETIRCAIDGIWYRRTWIPAGYSEEARFSALSSGIPGVSQVPYWTVKKRQNFPNPSPWLCDGIDGYTRYSSEPLEDPSDSMLPDRSIAPVAHWTNTRQYNNDEDDRIHLLHWEYALYYNLIRTYHGDRDDAVPLDTLPSQSEGELSLIVTASDSTWRVIKISFASLGRKNSFTYRSTADGTRVRLLATSPIRATFEASIDNGETWTPVPTDGTMRDIMLDRWQSITFRNTTPFDGIHFFMYAVESSSPATSVHFVPVQMSPDGTYEAPHLSETTTTVIHGGGMSSVYNGMPYDPDIHTAENLIGEIPADIETLFEDYALEHGSYPTSIDEESSVFAEWLSTLGSGYFMKYEDRNIHWAKSGTSSAFEIPESIISSDGASYTDPSSGVEKPLPPAIHTVAYPSSLYNLGYGYSEQTYIPFEEFRHVWTPLTRAELGRLNGDMPIRNETPYPFDRQQAYPRLDEELNPDGTQLASGEQGFKENELDRIESHLNDTSSPSLLFSNFFPRTDEAVRAHNETPNAIRYTPSPLDEIGGDNDSQDSQDPDIQSHRKGTLAWQTSHGVPIDPYRNGTVNPIDTWKTYFDHREVFTIPEGTTAMGDSGITNNDGSPNFPRVHPRETSYSREDGARRHYPDDMYQSPIIEYQKVIRKNYERLPGREQEEQFLQQHWKTDQEGSWGDGFSIEVTIPWTVNHEIQSPFSGSDNITRPIGEYFHECVKPEDMLRHHVEFFDSLDQIRKWDFPSYVDIIHDFQKRCMPESYSIPATTTGTDPDTGESYAIDGTDFTQSLYMEDFNDYIRTKETRGDSENQNLRTFNQTRGTSFSTWQQAIDDYWLALNHRQSAFQWQDAVASSPLPPCPDDGFASVPVTRRHDCRGNEVAENAFTRLSDGTFMWREETTTSLPPVDTLEYSDTERTQVGYIDSNGNTVRGGGKTHFNDPYPESADGKWYEECLGAIVKAKCVLVLEDSLGHRWQQTVDATALQPDQPIRGSDYDTGQ